MEGRRKAKGPKIINRYDPTKLERYNVDGKDQEFFAVPMRGPDRGNTRLVYAPSADQVIAQQTQPLKMEDGYWVFRDYLVEVEDEAKYRHDDMVLLIKRGT